MQSACYAIQIFPVECFALWNRKYNLIALKRVKRFVISSLRQNNLSSLAILYMENEVLKERNYNKLIDSL